MTNRDIPSSRNNHPAENMFLIPSGAGTIMKYSKKDISEMVITIEI